MEFNDNIKDYKTFKLNINQLTLEGNKYGQINNTAYSSFTWKNVDFLSIIGQDDFNDKEAQLFNIGLSYYDCGARPAAGTSLIAHSLSLLVEIQGLEIINYYNRKHPNNYIINHLNLVPIHNTVPKSFFFDNNMFLTFKKPTTRYVDITITFRTTFSFNVGGGTNVVYPSSQAFGFVVKKIDKNVDTFG